MDHRQLTATDLEDQLDETLFAALSSRRSVAPLAAAVAGLPRREQDFVLHWAKVAVQAAAEVGYQFVAAAPHALALLGCEGAARWILHALDLHDGQGLAPACAALRDVHGFRRRLEAEACGVALHEVARVLELVLRGLSGRSLRVASSPETYTDTETIFLPQTITASPLRAENERLYTATAAHHWAQARFGTFNADLGGALEGFASRERGLAWINALEAVRLEACLERGCPGLARLLASLRPPLPEALAEARATLSRAHAAVGDSIRLARSLAACEAPTPFAYMGVLHPERVKAVRDVRVDKERRALRRELAGLRERLALQRPETLGAPPGVEVEASLQTLQFRLEIGGEAIAPPERVATLVRSIVQDFGAVPPDYLVAAGPGPYSPGPAPEPEAPGVLAESHAAGGLLYDEWDFRRRDYRKAWCALFESDVPRGDAAFVAAVRAQFAGQIAQLRRRFEALRGEEKLLKREHEGDDLDFDAVVEACADRRTGIEVTERLFTDRRRAERNIAVMFMVDMSGSTRGWINECERTALVMLCEALEALGDRYAIYGFSGWSRKRCEIYRIKGFEERYSDGVRARIAGVEAKDYTRMGVAIRHLTKLLNEVEAKTRILFTLSDGKPDDFIDGYRGVYGIEDTRQALAEARQSGVHPFCITIDETARDYLPRMYGPASWVLIDDVRKLPLKAADVYRRLTR
jgi:nitric oxide reductase NorD protein